MKSFMRNFFTLVSLFALTACGGSGVSGGASPTVSGVAAVGAAISGTVSLKDLTGRELSITTSDGRYQFAVTGLTPPFILKAEWSAAAGATQKLYSLATSSGIANINPLTHLALSDAAAGTDLAALYNAPQAGGLAGIAAKVPLSLENLRTRLQPLLALYPGADVDPVTTPFVADHNGLDKLFDDTRIQISGTLATIKLKSDDTLLFSAVVGALGHGLTTANWNQEDAKIANDPHLVVDNNGNAMVAWVQKTSGHYVIWARRYTAGAGWGTAEQVSTSGDSGFPRLGIDGTGNATVVWAQWDGSKNTIMASRFIPGGSWSQPVVIEAGQSYSSYYPQIAVDDSGNAVVVWYDLGGLNQSTIWSNRYLAGNGWGTATRLSSNTTSAYRPQIGINASGVAVAVWVQSDDIWSSRYLPASGWGKAGQLTSGSWVYGQGHQVVVDSSGKATAIWGQSGSGGYNIWSRQSTADGSWGAAVPVGNNENDCYSESLAVDASGNVLAVWKQTNGLAYETWANRFVAGSGWGTALIISAEGADVDDPHVSVDAGGNGVAVWFQRDSDRFSIRMSRYMAGSGWGTAELMETIMPQSALDLYSEYPVPQVRLNGIGDTLLIWGMNQM